MTTEKRKKKSILVTFGILFAIFTLLMLLINGLYTYIVQTRTYQNEQKTKLKNLNAYMEQLLLDEGRDFGELKEYLKTHGEEVRIPYDYDNDTTPYQIKFEQLFNEKYPGKIYNRDIMFDSLTDDLKLAYAEYFMAKWLCEFDRAKVSFGIDYSYFVYPTGESDEVCYMIDMAREEKKIDGKSFIKLGITVPTDREKHKMLWDAWETGKSPTKFDVFDNEFGFMYTYYTPLQFSGEKVGIICADISVDKVRQDILISVLIQFLGSAVIMIAASVGIMFIIRKAFLVRILELAKHVIDYSEKKDVQIAKEIENSISTYDEIGELSEHFSGMITELKEYMENLQAVTAEKERIGAELNVATQIQADMLPRIFPPYPNRNDFSIYATMTPAKEVGGDFYDFFMVDENHLAMVMADVSGKGVPAALFMVIAKTLIKNRTLSGGTPSEILSDVNDQLCEGNEAELFVTVWLAIIDLRDGKGMAANAGHEHPGLRRADGQFELIKYRHSPAVATIEGIPFREHEFEMHPGDTLFVYTDGVTEATDAHNELFGEERLVTALNLKPEASPEELLPMVKEEIDQFVGDAIQFDDITMLGFFYEGASK